MEYGHKLQAILGGPAQYPQATGVSRKLFVDNLNFFLELIFYLGYTGTVFEAIPDGA